MSRPDAVDRLIVDIGNDYYAQFRVHVSKREPIGTQHRRHRKRLLRLINREVKKREGG